MENLCIHPFNDGNGRLNRLFTTLHLHRTGYVIGRYISLESKITQNKNLYYDALEACQCGWYENQEDPASFIKYQLLTSLASYRDFEERVDLVGEKLPIIEIVRRATAKSESLLRTISWNSVRLLEGHLWKNSQFDIFFKIFQTPPCYFLDFRI